jgi:hypothetical protein
LKGRISILPLDKGNKLQEGSRRLTKKEEFVCFFRKKKEEFVCFFGKEENDCGREELVFMCEKVLLMGKKNCVQIKNMERVVYSK